MLLDGFARFRSASSYISKECKNQYVKPALAMVTKDRFTFLSQCHAVAEAHRRADFAGFGTLDRRRAVPNRIELFVSARHYQPGQAGITIRVFAAKAGAKSYAQGVIKIDHGIDRGQAPVLLNTLPQRLHRARSLLGIRAECAKRTAPGFQVLRHPHGWRRRNGRDRRGIGRMEVPHRHAQCAVFRIPPPDFGFYRGKKWGQRPSCRTTMVRHALPLS